jgi:hypothetical protein
MAYLELVDYEPERAKTAMTPRATETAAAS